MLKTQQWYQSLGLFSLILDANCLKLEVLCCLDRGLDESIKGLDDSKAKLIQLAEFVHALDELDPQTTYLRVLVLELV